MFIQAMFRHDPDMFAHMHTLFRQDFNISTMVVTQVIDRVTSGPKPEASAKNTQTDWTI